MSNPKITPQPRLTPLRPRDQRQPPDPKAARDPLGFDHPYPSMLELARRLALHTDSPRTRESYYRDIRLLHQHFERDPASLDEEQCEKLGWGIDPSVRAKDWCVHVRPAGDGAAAVKYLGAYVSTGPLGASRLLDVSGDTVTFRFKDRPNGGGWRNTTIPGTEFVSRWLRHVLPRGTRSIRYYGLHHASRRDDLERVRFLTGQIVHLGAPPEKQRPPRPPLPCPCCGLPMIRVCPVGPGGTFPARAPPST